MKPLFFGPSERQLFGIFHAPPRPSRDVGVVLCYPGVQEYNRVHWTFRKLAAMLAGQGLPVLRFDYSGTGDSAGDPTTASLDVWESDLREACNELRDVFDVSSVSVIGMRLGGTVAARACASGLSMRDLFLWDPVVTGATYLAELDALHRSIDFHLLHSPRERPADELVGFRMSRAQRDEVERIDLRAIPRVDARRVEVFASRARAEMDHLKHALAPNGRSVVTHLIDEAGSLNEAASHGNAFVAREIVTSIVRRMVCT